MGMSNVLRKTWFGCFVALSAVAQADLVVIANPQSGVDQLTRSQVINIFLGSHREFPNGLPAKPIDLPVAAPEKAAFYQGLVNKDLDQMAAYWSRLVFAGNTSPPTQANNLQSAVQTVASTRGAIAYVDRRDVDPLRVKVVFTVR
jgi:ABC-type phosphate transport system substrate-binding protein